MPRARNTDSPWTMQLEAALLRALVTAWKAFNWDAFRNAMTPPAIELVEATSTLGRWVPDRRAIELSRAMTVAQPWAVTIEVLKHEMAHQYVDEVLGVTDETAHGPRFRQVCETIGIDPAAAGLPTVDAVASDEATRVLDKIRKLLALAESPNRNEAESAAAAAQRLLLKHNLDRVADTNARGYAVRHLGEPTGRVSEADNRLATILEAHFFVDVIWISVYRPREGKRGSVLELCGTPSNLEIAEYVHAFLKSTADRLWREHQRADGVRSNRDRRRFVAGVMAGFDKKLASEKIAAKQAGLVWVGDADLSRFFRRRHPHIRRSSYGGGHRGEAFARGHAAGTAIQLHRGVGGAAVSRGRLLGS
ncbi:MAG: SprT-like domain-containing protein [Polyangiales bacterium]